MNPYKLFATDKKAEVEQGIDLDYGSFKIRIVRAGGANRKFAELLNRRLKPHRRQIDNETMDNEVARRIMAEVYADTIILGWEGVADASDAPIEFSRSACVTLLLDLPDLFADIQEQANKAALFRAADREDDSKNSQSGSTGSLSTLES